MGIIFSSVGLLAAVFIIFVLWSTWPPGGDDETFVDCPANTIDTGKKTLAKNSRLKMMSWNVQFMAGKGYVFFFDVLEGTGKDTRPTRQSIETTLQGVARTIEEENPDFVFLQEIDDGAKRTDFEDQLKRLLSERNLSERYPCRASTFYWKVKFVPHRKVWGAAGLKLVVLSKYDIKTAKKISLPLFPAPWIVQQFQLKRVVLEITIPRDQGPPLHLLNTHLEAFAQGSSLMARQIGIIASRLEELNAEGAPWVFAGDLNLLLPGQLQKLPLRQQAYFQEPTELLPLLKYDHFPTEKDLNSNEGSRFLSHFPNDPAVTKPDRTIDYQFFSKNLRVLRSQVQQNNTINLSDHFPVMSEFEVK